MLLYVACAIIAVVVLWRMRSQARTRPRTKTSSVGDGKTVVGVHNGKKQRCQDHAKARLHCSPEERLFPDGSGQPQRQNAERRLKERTQQLLGQHLDIGVCTEPKKDSGLLENDADRQHDECRRHADEHLLAAHGHDTEPLHCLAQRASAEPTDANHRHQGHQNLLGPQHAHRDAAAQIVLFGQKPCDCVETDGQCDQHVDQNQHGQ